MKKNFVEAIIKEPGRWPRKVLIQNELEVFQAIVEGYIQTVDAAAIELPRGFGRHVLICDDEGEIRGAFPNFNIWKGLDWISGTAILVGVRRDEFWDVHPDVLDWWEYSIGQGFLHGEELETVKHHFDEYSIITLQDVQRLQEEMLFPGKSLEEVLEDMCEEYEENEGYDLEDQLAILLGGARHDEEASEAL